MTKTWKRLLAAALAGSFLVSLPVYAAKTDEIKNKIEQSKKQQSQKENEIKNIESQQQDVMQEKEALDNQINEIQKTIDEIESVIDESDRQIVAKNEELSAAEERLAAVDDQLKQRVKSMYMNGNTSYLEILFGAESFSDLLTRVNMLKYIVDNDNKIIAEVVADKNTIEQAKAVIEEQKNEQETAKELQVSEKRRMEASVARQQEIMKSLEDDKDKLRAEQEKLKASEDELMREMDRIEAEERERERQAAQSGSSSSGGTVTRGSGVMGWPLAVSGRITSRFGYRSETAINNHTGIDIAASTGTAILAADSGTVSAVRYDKNGYGNYVLISHGGGLFTLYGHCSATYVSVGQSVSKGQKIAAVGSTGYSTGPHLHFEVRVGGVRVNPEPYIS